MSVEVTESKEQLDFFNRGRGLLLADARQLSRIHGYLPRMDNHTKVVDLLSVKGAFFGFQEKGFFPDDFKDTESSFLVFF
jgi:hypothetical protein